LIGAPSGEDFGIVGARAPEYTIVDDRLPYPLDDGALKGVAMVLTLRLSLPNNDEILGEPIGRALFELLELAPGHVGMTPQIGDSRAGQIDDDAANSCRGRIASGLRGFNRYSPDERPIRPPRRQDSHRTGVQQ
jgi:hypothetical protein